MVVSYNKTRHLPALERLKPALAWRSDEMTLQAGVSWFKYSDKNGVSCRTRNQEELRQLLKALRATLDCNPLLDSCQNTSCQFGENSLSFQIARVTTSLLQYTIACNGSAPLVINPATLRELGSWLSYFLDQDEPGSHHEEEISMIETCESGLLLYLNENAILPLKLNEALQLQQTLLEVVAEGDGAGNWRSFRLADGRGVNIRGNTETHYGEIWFDDSDSSDGSDFSELDMVLLAAELAYQLEHHDRLLEEAQLEPDGLLDGLMDGLLDDDEDYPL